MTFNEAVPFHNVIDTLEVDIDDGIKEVQPFIDKALDNNAEKEEDIIYKKNEANGLVFHERKDVNIEDSHVFSIEGQIYFLKAYKIHFLLNSKENILDIVVIGAGHFRNIEVTSVLKKDCKESEEKDVDNKRDRKTESDVGFQANYDKRKRQIAFIRIIGRGLDSSMKIIETYKISLVYNGKEEELINIIYKNIISY